MSLTVLTVSKLDQCAIRFIKAMETLGSQFVIAADGEQAFHSASELDVEATVVKVHSKGYIESVLDQALEACNGDYVLRLDDDELVSEAMANWLQNREWERRDHWEFPRIHLWGDGVLLTPQLFPDHQTRLSIKSKSGGRHGVHAGSPFGGGETAPVCIEHHKFIVKSSASRLAVAQNYDRYCSGYGTGNMKPFSLPEEAYHGQTVTIAAMWDGSMPRKSDWEREEQW